MLWPSLALLLLLSGCAYATEKEREKTREERKNGGGERERVASLVVAEGTACIARFLSEVSKHRTIKEIPLFVGLSQSPPSSLSPSLFPSLTLTALSFPAHYSSSRVHNALLEEIQRRGFTIVVIFSDTHAPLESTNVTRLIDTIVKGEGEISSAKGCLDKDFCSVAPRCVYLWRCEWAYVKKMRVFVCENAMDESGVNEMAKTRHFRLSAFHSSFSAPSTHTHTHADPSLSSRTHPAQSSSFPTSSLSPTHIQNIHSQNLMK